MILTAAILSLKILAIYIVFSQGMLLGWVPVAVSNFLDKKVGKLWSRYLQKPLWECYICMSSVWTIVLTADFDIHLMLLVCGINFVISKTILSDEADVN